MELETLVQQPDSLRDDAWEARFLDLLVQSKVIVESEEPKPGPDGWPYLMVRTGPGAGEPLIRVVNWLASRGIGMAVNSHKMVPDYIFTFGMLWHFVATGRFLVRSPDHTPPPGARLISGAPAESYLPAAVRTVLREFLRAQGFSDPRILVLSTPDFRFTELAFSLESLGGLAPADQEAFARAVAWFLPLHYRLALVTERNLPDFHPL